MGAAEMTSLGLRVAELIFSVIVMALSGNMISMYIDGSPPSVNYAMFASAFSIFTLIYLFPASVNTNLSGHPIVMVVVDTLNAIWFLTSGIVLASRIKVFDCDSQGILEDNRVTNDSAEPPKTCREAKSTDAFLWFAWACYTASMIVSFIQAMRSRGASRAGGRGGGRARPAKSPMMTQV
ncbi:Non-classical export protein [Aspergillus sp. HF37]|nr:Non-classical export protein [Aspergillus sp. HF37]